MSDALLAPALDRGASQRRLRFVEPGMALWLLMIGLYTCQLR